VFLISSRCFGSGSRRRHRVSLSTCRRGEPPAACSRPGRRSVLTELAKAVTVSRPLAVSRVAFARSSGGVSLLVGFARRVARPPRPSPRRGEWAVAAISAYRSPASKWHATSAAPEVISVSFASACRSARGGGWDWCFEELRFFAVRIGVLSVRASVQHPAAHPRGVSCP